MPIWIVLMSLNCDSMFGLIVNIGELFSIHIFCKCLKLKYGIVGGWVALSSIHNFAQID